MDTSKKYTAYPHLEYERKVLLYNKSQINFIDLGAGKNTGKRTVAQVAKSSLSSIDQSRLLFNIINKYKPKTTIELGTSLGISTLYMAKAFKSNQIYTIEGNPSSAKMAHILFEKNHVPNIKLYNASFDDKLPQLLSEIDTVDLAFIDGNHTKEATIRYFNWIKAKCKPNSILIFDDIYWSKGMKEAWNTVIADKEVTLSVDIFDMGIVFFNKSLSKENIALINYWKKPWKIGVFG